MVCFMNAVKYEVRLEDGTLIAKSDGVEFSVQDGEFEVSLGFYMVLILISYQYNCLSAGHFCPALPKAVKTMKKGEKVILTVKPQCKSFPLLSTD